MAGGNLFTAPPQTSFSNINMMLQNQTAAPPTSHTLDSHFLSASAPYLGSRSMVSFEDVKGGKGCNGSFFSAFHQPEKKRRLSTDQVQFMEKSFEVENKLEPERKTKLAKDLGLEPRQVAIWFQNRRARWKTKQLEKDYDSLQSSYDTLKTNFDNLLKEQERLKAEVANLAEKMLVREKQGGKFKQAESETKGLQEPAQRALLDSVSEGEGSKVSAKSDILDSDSPHYTDGVHSALLEPGDQSDLSQDEENNLRKSFFPKLEDVDYSYPHGSSCNFGFTEEDHGFWPWSY